MQGVGVLSQIKELRSHMSHGMTREKKFFNLKKSEGFKRLSEVGRKPKACLKGNRRAGLWHPQARAAGPDSMSVCPMRSHGALNSEESWVWCNALLSSS